MEYIQDHSLVPAKLEDWLNKFWFIQAFYKHKKNGEPLYKLKGKYIQEMLINMCVYGGCKGEITKVQINSYSGLSPV